MNSPVMNSRTVVICGPTGAGKSSLAISLARDFSGEVINCDSLQVYRHFDIGAAKTPVLERLGVPHHLIDAVEAPEGFTAGEYARLGRAALASISARGHLPIVAGGTGFYLRALIEGLSPAPSGDPTLRARLLTRENRRPGSLHHILRRLDPPSAARIHPRDLPKLVRALEIRLLSRRTASAQPQRDRLSGYRILTLGLFPPRDQLYAVLDRRCESILDGGLLPEIMGILAAGVPRDARPFLSLGYKEGLAILEKRMSHDEALAQMRRDTRRYAKRQITWFRNQTAALPLEGFGNDPAIEDAARALVRALLK